MAYEVVHPLVYVRDAPTIEGAQIRTLRKGETVNATARFGDWIRVSNPGQAQWILVDGKTIGIGKLLELAIIHLPPGTKWLVTRKERCDVYESPGGAKELGMQGLPPLWRLHWVCAIAVASS